MDTSLPLSPIPRFQKALIAISPGELALKPVSIPHMGRDDVLVKVNAVALNPSDHKLLDQSTTVGAICGSDYAGVIIRIGESVDTGLRIGDRVFGVVFGSNPGNPHNGAFSSYVAAQSRLCIRIPDNMSFESAASMGMAINTMALVFQSLGLRVEGLKLDQPGKSTIKEFVLVYGGATATGTIAIQMLKHSGYIPITTCSPRNFELVKSRGAVEAFDYKSPDCKDQIMNFTKGGLSYVLDCIGSATTLSLCYGCFGESGGRYCALEMYPRRLTVRRRNVKAAWILGWTIFGKEVKLAGAYGRPECWDDYNFVGGPGGWIEMLNELLPTAKIVPHPLEVNSAGLIAIPASLKDLREGKVSGKKLVFTCPL